MSKKYSVCFETTLDGLELSHYEYMDCNRGDRQFGQEQEYRVQRQGVTSIATRYLRRSFTQILSSCLRHTWKDMM